MSIVESFEADCLSLRRQTPLRWLLLTRVVMAEDWTKKQLLFRNCSLFLRVVAVESVPNLWSLKSTGLLAWF
jgi:hypothetical protein